MKTAALRVGTVAEAVAVVEAVDPVAAEPAAAGIVSDTLRPSSHVRLRLSRPARFRYSVVQAIPDWQ